ncbi:hypothetical protein Tco_0955652 [Tanacetum coccineum]|uniref:Uncharacterized protein n=1 Tax=Tanacetum coccineum TaxID=301880 RepID=A0ABQ5E7V2_9ASTR
MLLNVDQLQKKLDKDEFQEDGSMTAFWVVNNQFQKFIDSKFTLDYDSQMTDTYFVEYTESRVQHFKIYTTPTPGCRRHESKIDTGKALMLIWLTQKSIRTKLYSCQMTDAGQGMIQMLMMQISMPIYDESQWRKSMVAEKADISETIVKMDLQMMIQKDDV